MRTFTALLALSLLACTSLGAETPWHPDLACAGDGVWTIRVPVTVTNTTGGDAAGTPVELAVGAEKGQLPFAGQSLAELRVCDADGAELLYDVLDGKGLPKRTGDLAAGDRLVFGVACPSGGEARVYAYTENGQAWPVPDYLGAGAPFLNGGFEDGAGSPLGWQEAETSTSHRVSWTTEEPRTGSRCTRCDVDPGAEPAWVKYAQAAVRVVPDADYRLEAWVRARDVKGTAGWFVHVHGGKGMAVNRTLNAGEGSFEWKRVEVTFHTPADAVSATVGTVLHGTGTAWYDDAALTLLTETKPLRAVAGEPERCTLAAAPRSDAWRRSRASHRVELVVRNWRDGEMRSLMSAAAGQLRHRLPRALRAAPLVVVDPGTGEALPCVQSESRLFFAARVPGMSEKVYHAYPEAPSRLPFAAKPPEATFAALAASEANLVRNAGFEAGMEPWVLSAERDAEASRRVEGGTDPEAHSGAACARFSVPQDAPLRWYGWRQAGVPVKPRTTYLYAGYLRCRDLRDGSVQLHGHCYNAEGKHCAENAFFGVGPAFGGTQGWTLLAGLVRTPADCATVEIHLTMNARGTVWHDDVFFGEAGTAAVGKAHARKPREGDAAAKRGYAVWAVNPIEKVFPEDPPEREPRVVEAAAARGEAESVQIAVRAFRDLEKVTVLVDPPRHASGAMLPRPEVRRVGFVPIDHPSSYYRVAVPAWHRKRAPRGQSGCDGWEGLWPDPLLPHRAFAVPAAQTQPMWITLRVPAGAEPGVYHSSIAVQPGNEPTVRIPLRVTVWDFDVPATSRLKVIYDFREGHNAPFGDTGDGARRRWYRFMAEHRVSPGILPAPRFARKDGRITLDTAEFDQAAAICLDELGMNVFYSPWFFYAFGWARPPKPVLGAEPFSKDYVETYTACLRMFMAHLREKGWADKMILYISDEPHFDQESVREQMVKVCEMIRSVEPEMPIYSSTWRYCPQWADHISVWGAGPHGSFPVDVLQGRQAAGDTIWFTTDGHMCTDTPYCAIERLLPWLCWKYGVEAYEFWGLNWYTYDPWQFGWHRFISQSDDGKRYYYVRYPNGDGYLAYPGAPVDVQGPVSTVRLEQAREGIEDSEYLFLLDSLLQQARRKGLRTTRESAARAAAAGLVGMPNRGGRYSTALLPDPDAVPRLRGAVAGAIESLQRRLRAGSR